jgi:hypothetical protein
MTMYKKHQIVESLNAMDPAQTEKVLQYVKSIVAKSEDETAYDRFKKNALREIRQALAK